MPARRILFVEDQRDVANMLGLALRGEGYDLEIAGTAARALACLSAQPYDLLITDYRLPDGNGLDIADKAADRGIRTMMLSGFLFMIPAAKAARHELLMKPMRPFELIDAVKRMIGPAVDP